MKIINIINNIYIYIYIYIDYVCDVYGPLVNWITSSIYAANMSLVLVNHQYLLEEGSVQQFIYLIPISS